MIATVVEDVALKSVLKGSKHHLHTYVCFADLLCSAKILCKNHSAPIGLVFTCRGDGSNVDFAEILDALSSMFSNLSSFRRNVGWWFKLPGRLSDMFSNWCVTMTKAFSV